ncbi:BTAD domain-containing putative transcriptional regulator [Halanaerobaculum tunisiense]
MKNTIAMTKFNPSLANKNSWKQKRLWSKYAQIKDYPLTVIKAGPGHGKSNSIAFFLTKNYPNNFFWYSIDNNDTDTSHFLLNLFYAFKAQNENIGAEEIKLLTKSDSQQLNLEQLITQFTNNLMTELSQESFLVLDDFHLVIENQDISNLLAYFIKSLPPNLHLIINSRKEMQFAEWNHWRVKQQVLTIDENLLTLNPSEIKYFFSDQYSRQFSKTEIDEIYNKTQGWILALDLLGSSLDTELKELFSEESEYLNLLFQYLTAEILLPQSEEIQNFLFQTAILKQPRIDICNQLLGIDHSQKIFNELSDYEFFISNLEDGSYSYHYLLHRLLQNKGAAKFDYQKLHQSAADLFLELEEEANALYHSLHANNYEQTAKLVIQTADKLLKSMNYNELLTILNQLPEEIFSDYPLLYLYLGDIYRFTSRFDQAVTAYKQAQNFFETDNNQTNLNKILTRLSRLYLNTIQPNLAAQYLNQFQQLITETDAEDNITLLKMKTENQANSGQLNKIAELQDRIQQTNSNKLQNSNLLSWIKLRTGQLDEAQSILKDNLDATKKQNRTHNSYKEAPLLLSLIYSLQGKTKKAKLYAKQGIELGNQFNSPLIKAVSQARLGHAYQLYFQYTRNKEYSTKLRECYHKSIELAEEIDLPRSKAEALLGLSFFEGFYGSTNSSLDYAQEGIKICRQAGDEWMAHMFKITLGINSYFSENLGKAKKLFKQVNNFFTTNENHLGKAISKLWLSLIAYQQKDWNNFTQLTKSLFNITAEYNYNFLFFNASFLASLDPAQFMPVLLEAAKRGIKSDYISALMPNKFDINKLPRHPGYTLGLKTFGNLQVWRGSLKIKDKTWNRKKAKELLQLFIVNRSQLIPKEKIYSAIWPESTEEKAYSNFYVTLNHLNKILEPNRKSQEDPFFIIRRDSSYGLNKKACYCIDCDKFEKLIERGNNAFKPEEKVHYYESALNVYQDDFFADTLYLDGMREERQRLKNIFLNTADELMDHYYTQQEFQNALRIANRILEVDDCWENAYVIKMKIYRQLNQRPMFVHTYNKYEQVLKNKLDVLPAPEIKRLYKQIK